MKLTDFNSLVGQDSYVRCQGKKRIDTAIVNLKLAENHLLHGGTIGWWVKSGYIIVDIDEGKEEALAIIKKLKLKTLICKTPKGLHLYFKNTKDFPQKIGMVLPFGLKCDYRVANKGYVLLPFCTEDRRFNNFREIAELPLEFTPMQNRKESLLGLREGDGRNATIFAHLMAYKNKGASEEQIEVMADIINHEVFAQPMKQSELDQIVINTNKYQANTSDESPYLIYNEKGKATAVNNRAIVDYFVNSGDVFVLGGECYKYYNGIYSEASSLVRNSIREMIGVDHLITQFRILEAFRLLIDDTRIQKNATDLNNDKNLINFTSGVWNIKEKKMELHDSRHLQTIQVPHNVTKSNKVLEDTKLYRYLEDKAGLSEEDIEMCLKYMAYCLTLNHGLKTFLVLNGPSNTGKSVLIRFFENMVGRENTSALSMHELNMRFYPSQLYNRLLNSCADNSALPLSSIESLKKITGGDMIMHERKGKEPFFFVPFSKLLFSFNQMPLQLEEKSNAFYKRMRVLTMSKELYLNDKYVNDLCSVESIEEMLPHLLQMLPLTSIPRTENSDRIVDSLRKDSDSIHAFMTDMCVLGKPKYVPKKDFYEHYCTFCIENGREAHKKHAFLRHIKSQGFKEGRHPKTRESCWRGVGMRKSR